MNRRTALALAVGAATSLAGCGGSARSSGDVASNSSGTDRTVTDGPNSGTETNPETVLVRADTDRQPIWLAETDGNDGGRPAPRPDQRHIHSIVVDTASRADRLSVDPEVDGDGVESFLAATNFDEETVVVETMRVEACFRLSLCRISWQPQKISTDYTQRSRGWDEACAADEWVFEARLIRIPDPIQADTRRVGSTSVGTTQCQHNDTQTEASEGGGSNPSIPSDTGSETRGRTDTATGGASS